MRRKNLISPEKPTQDQLNFGFEPLFLPVFFIITPIAALLAVCGEMDVLQRSRTSNLTIIFSVIWLLYVTLTPYLATLFYVKSFTITVRKEGLSGFNLWGRRTYIDWQEITLIKPYQVLGMRHLSIKTVYGKNIQLATRLYETAKILDRVRELAGEDHILVRALEKELSRPRYELTKLWVGVIGSIALTMSIYLIGGNMYAAEQEKPLEQAIASYVRQHPKTAPNQSAIDLQTLMAKLGLSVEVFGDGTEAKVKPDKLAIAELKAIQNTLDEYSLKQLNKVDSSIEALPNKLSSYLKTHQTDIQAIETQLINNLIPEWGSDSGWVEKSDPKAGDSSIRSKFMNYFSIANIEHIIIVNILDKIQIPNTSISSDLAAIEKIQQSFQTQPSLVGQLISRIGENRISKLVRKLDTVPTGWGENLFSRDRYQRMYSAIENDSMSDSRFFQSLDIFNQLLKESKTSLRFIPGYSHLIHPRIRLAAVDRDREIKKRLAYWSRQNICRTDGKSGVKSPEVTGLEDYRDLSFPTRSSLTSQYPKVSKQDLIWELTTSVRQVKAKLAAGENIDLVAKGFNLPSKACPGEQWTAMATNGTVEIAFSHPPDWKVLNTTSSTYVEQLTYKIKLLER